MTEIFVSPSVPMVHFCDIEIVVQFDRMVTIMPYTKIHPITGNEGPGGSTGVVLLFL